MRRIQVLALGFAVGAAFPASAQMLVDQAPPQHRLVHRNTVAVRYNALGLIYDSRFTYRYRLYQSESKAFRDNFLGLGVAPVLSPAYLRLGPQVDFQPLTVLGFWASIQYVQYYGTFDLFQSFPHAGSRFSDSELRSRSTLPQGDPNRAYPTGGWELSMGANLQLKISSVVLRNATRVVRPNMALRNGDKVFYDQMYDVSVPNGGWVLTDDLDVLWQSDDGRIVAGGRYTFTTPFYEQRHLPPGETAVDNSMHRAGPFLAYTFFSQDGAGVNNPTVFFLAQWWAKHRFRAGQEVSQIIPLVATGVQITGDFMPVR